MALGFAPFGLERQEWTLMVHCFLDDSGKEGDPSHPWVCMAGYFASDSSILDLNNRWVALLTKHRIPVIHMREIIGLKGPYAKLDWDIPKRDAVLADFIEVIRAVPMTGIGVAVETATWRSIRKTHRHLFLGDIHQFCVERILRRMTDRLEVVDLGEPHVALVFDTDPDVAKKRFDTFMAIPVHDRRALMRLRSITFGHAVWFPGLQCADLLVWETRKEMVQAAGGHGQTRRWKQLFEAMPNYELDYIGERWDAAEFEKFLPQLEEIAARNAALSGPQPA